MELRCIAGESEGERTLKSLLRGRLQLSAGQLRRVKREGGLLVNGQPASVDFRLRPGDEVTVLLASPDPDFPAEDGELCLLYEDEALLAVDKPRGIIVHPTHSRLTGTLANRVWKHIRDGGGDGCHVLNRLDRDTGGVVLFAKNSHICARMAGAVTEKRYLAVVCGVPAEETGSITLPIRRMSGQELKRICAPDGSPARTDYRVLRVSHGLSLLELRLHTGRTHQIRVHCAAMGWPLLGDRLYGTEESLCRSEALGETMQALWCVGMAFRHPLSGEVVSVEAAPRGLDWGLFGDTEK